MLNLLKKLFGTYKPAQTDSVSKEAAAPYKVEAPVLTDVVAVTATPKVEEIAPVKKAKKPAKPKAHKREE